MSWITINWDAFGRTRGGFVDKDGNVSLPPKKPDPPAIEGRPPTGAWCAPATPLYNIFGMKSYGERWDDWVEWHLIIDWNIIGRPVRESLPTIRAERGGIRYINPLQ
jgi:hypothetical protein